MEEAGNYPAIWEMSIDIQDSHPKPMKDAQEDSVWYDWSIIGHGKQCDWQPESFVSSWNGDSWQDASWEAVRSVGTGDALTLKN